MWDLNWLAVIGAALAGFSFAGSAKGHYSEKSGNVNPDCQMPISRTPTCP